MKSAFAKHDKMHDDETVTIPLPRHDNRFFTLDYSQPLELQAIAASDSGSHSNQSNPSKDTRRLEA